MENRDIGHFFRCSGYI